MAKKNVGLDERAVTITEETFMEPCWRRYPDQPASYCFVQIIIGGSAFSAHAVLQEKEETTLKDVPALKRARVRSTLEVLHARAMEFMNG